MTNEEILKKAIEKAVKSGFEKTIAWSWEIHFERGEVGFRDYAGLIFQKEFAKAFWGEWNRGEHYIDCEDEYGEITKQKWQYHLQQMVISEDPIKYLEKFI